MRKIFTEKVRQALFTVIPIIFLGANSIYYAIENKPDEFSKFGAIITIWAIFNISRLRNSYSGSIASWDRSIFYKYVEFYKEKDNLQEERLDTTFNLHACQVAQISAHLDVPNPFVENNKEVIEKFCRDVQSKIDNQEEFQSRYNAAQQRINKFVDEYRDSTASIRRWEPLLWNIEIGLAIWGTLQNAYGGDFVRILHSL